MLEKVLSFIDMKEWKGTGEIGLTISGGRGNKLHMQKSRF